MHKTCNSHDLIASIHAEYSPHQLPEVAATDNNGAPRREFIVNRMGKGCQKFKVITAKTVLDSGQGQNVRK